MNRTAKRLLSLVMAMILAVTMTVPAFAEEMIPPEPEIIEESPAETPAEPRSGLALITRKTSVSGAGSVRSLYAGALVRAEETEGGNTVKVRFVINGATVSGSVPANAVSFLDGAPDAKYAALAVGNLYEMKDYAELTVEEIVEEQPERKDPVEEIVEEQPKQTEPAGEIVEEQPEQEEPAEETVGEQPEQTEPIEEIVEEQPEQTEPAGEIVEEQPEQEEPVEETVGEQPEQIEPIEEIVEEQPEQKEPVEEIVGEQPEQEEPVEEIVEEQPEQEEPVGGTIEEPMLFGIAPVDETVFTPLVNGKSADNGAGLSVSYLEPLTLSLSGFTSDDGDPSSIVFYCRDAATPAGNWFVLPEGPCVLEPGQYVLTYSYNDNDEYAVDGPEADFGFTVTKAAVSAPGSLRWDGSNPAWTAPVTTADGGALPEGVIHTYTLIVYKNGEELDRFPAFDYGYPNFANHISGAGYREGLYTFAVEIAVTEEAKAHFTDTSVSGFSPAFAVPVVKVLAGNGVASVQPTEKLLIPGDPDGVAIKATVKAGYGFTGWTGTGARFADSAAPETTVFVDADYTGGTSLEITAHAKDTSGPVISDFKSAGSGKLTAKAIDLQDGVAAYAFTTETEAENVVWTSVSSAGEQTFEYPLTAGGIYTFFAKDAAGNISRSDHTLRVTEVRYHDYPTAEGPKSLSDFIVENAAVTVPVPVRPAYVFGGWFTDPEHTLPAESAYAEHSAAPYELYALWTPVTLPEITVAGVSRAYSGYETLLTPVMTPVSGTLSYAWTRNGAEIGTGEKLSVKNVADSGTYTLTVTLKDAEGNTVDTQRVENISVSVTPADLTARADSMTVFSGAPVPEYTVTFTGLLGDDTEAVVDGLITCAYTPASSVGRYPISLSGFRADNYTVTPHDGTLTVNATEADLTVAFKDGTPVYTYEKNTVYTPEVSVTLGETPLSPGDYMVSYADNGKAGTATVTVTSDYFAAKTLSFTINKAAFTAEALISDRKYGETAAAPALSAEHPENAAVTWYYAERGTENYTTVFPENAGDYTARAAVAETDNYLAFETAKKDFTVQRREIKVTAASATFVYDGLAHSDNGYTVTGDGFVPGQSFYSVTVTGSVTAVTPEDQTPNNHVTYTLTSNTLPGNYDIQTVSGTLTVTKDTLTPPFNPRWHSDRPGTATWVPVSRRDLTTRYHVELLAFDGTEYLKIVETDTSESAVDFSAAIRNHAAVSAARGTSFSYFFTVKAMPSAGANRDNYRESAPTAEIGEIFTAVVTVAGNHLKSAGIASGTSHVLLDGETVSFEALTDTGYVFADPALSLSDSHVLLADSNPSETAVTGHVKAALTASLPQVTLTFLTEDKAPEITAAGFVNTSPHDKVTVSFTAHDDLGLTHRVIKKGASLPAEDEWLPIDKIGENAPHDHTCNLEVTEPGQYYAFFRDVAGNVSVSDDSYTIYRYLFAPGAEDATGTMTPVLKERGETVTLPTVGYARPGYSFRNWKGAAGVFEDGAKIGANPAGGSEETLTALWSQNQYAYTVRYFLMDADGSYPADPYSAKTFYSAYNEEKRSELDALKLDLTGFTRDDTRSSAITVTADGQTLDIYYSRDRYNLTFSYTVPGDSAPTETTVSRYYGADLSDAFGPESKPSVPGYHFVGWFFGDTGAQPATMPAANVTATGSFTNEVVRYHVNVYLQNLNPDDTAADTYTLYPEGSKTLTAVFGDALAADSATAEVPDGFSWFGANVTDAPYDTSSVTLPSDVSPAVSATAAANRSVNIFLNRNTYSAILKVWQGKVNEGSPVYTVSESLLYGAAFPAGFADKDKTQWPAGDNYRLADYIGWSTDSEPTVMPAGDVTVTRQFVLKVTGTYRVEVYLETENDGVYESPRVFTFYENVGQPVSIGEAEGDTMKPSDFAGGIPYYEFYEYAVVPGEGGTLTSGTVTDTNAGETELVLRIYMNRKVMTSTVTYYADTLKIAQITKSAKWGHTYHYDALSLFDASVGGVWTEGEPRGELTVFATLDGTSPDAYDFRNNNYVAIYSGYYVMNDKDNWPAKDFNTVASLSENPAVIMGQKSNSATVRYSKVDPDLMYRLQLGYNSSALSHGENKYVPLTYRDEAAGLSFTEIWVANEAYFFENVTYIPDPAYTDYPALGMYNLKNGMSGATDGRYDYDASGALKNGFNRILINGKTYYQNGSALYIPVTKNNLFAGKWTSYSIPVTEVGYGDVTDFLASYKAQWPDDPYAQGAYVYSRGWGSTVKYDTNDAKLTITFRNGDVYRISYNLGGTVCRDNSHRFAAGTSVTDIGCDHAILIPREGYDIVWYADSAFSSRPVLPFTLTEDRIFYGRYEKKIVKNTAYAYYETADHPEIGGVTYTYITEKDLPALGSAVSVETTLRTVNVPDETGALRAVELTEKVYRYDGQIVMVSEELPTLTFAEAEADLSLFPAVPGTRYDNANPGNILKGYVQHEGIDFTAYFVRGRVTLTVDPATENTDPETSECRIGQLVTVPTPTRNGYSFAGWTWTVTDTSGRESAWTGAPAMAEGAAEITFVLPETSVKMTARWATADVNQTVYHFFRNHSGSYGKEATLAMLTEAGTAASLSLDGSTVPCRIYAGGGLSVEQNGVRLYYTSAKQNGDVYTVNPEDLAGTAGSFTALQEQTLPVAGGILTLPHYHFSYALCEYAGDVERLEKDDTYVNRFGMTLEYYYDPDTFDIDTESVVLGGTGTLSILGGGTFGYGKTITLRAAMSAGYTFEGWYKTADLPESVTADTLPADKRVSAELTLSLRVTEADSYTAVMKALAADSPDIRISGAASFRYNAPGDHVMSAGADFGEGADTTNAVTGYQWYLNGEAVPGATGSDYKLPAGLAAGSYTVTCEVTAGRKDNGVTLKTLSAPFALTVEKDLLASYTEALDHSALYDTRDDHRITLNVTPPESGVYEIYYSTEKELTADNLADGTKTAPSFRNVRTDASGNLTSYTVWYYVKSLNDNYASCSGSRRVTIRPVPLTLSAGTGSYAKVYDGSADVAGSAGPDGEGTDLYKLTHSDSVYVINGLLPGDTTKGYIISCAAAFNSLHAADATAVTLSDILLADRDGNILYNYTFNPTYTVTLSGYIERRPLTLSWSDLSFPFDGDTHTPTVSLPSDLPARDKDHLGVAAGGSQAYAGQWEAVARLTSDSPDTRADDYSPINGSVTFSIGKRAISFAMVSGEVTYDGASHTLTDSRIAAGSLVAGHSYTLDPDQSAIHAGTTAVTPVNVVIKDAAGAVMTGNYDITCLSDGILTVNPRKVTVSGVTAADKVYDGATAAAPDATGAVFTGLIEGDNLSLDGSRLTADFDTADAGEGKTVTLRYAEGALTGADVADYVLDIPGSQQTCAASILRREVTVTAKNAETVYGEIPSFESELTGFIPGEDKSLVSGTVTYRVGNSEAAAAACDGTEHVGTYTVYPVVSALSATNYRFTPVNATLTVTGRPLTVAAKDGALISKTYDGTTEVRTALTAGTHYVFGAVTDEAASGIVNGDTVNLLYTAAYDDIHPLTRVITVGGLSLDNTDYTLRTVSFTVAGEITRKTVTVTAEKKTVTYGDPAPAFTVSYDGFEHGETRNVLSGTLAFACAYDPADPANRHVGNYPITPSGLTSDDYLVEFRENTLTVNPAEITLTVTTSADTLIYGTLPLPVFGYTPSGFMYGEDATVIRIADNTVNYSHTLTETTVTDDDGTRKVIDSVPDDYPVTLEQTRNGQPVFTADNYTFKIVPVTVKITRAELTVGGIKINSRVYDGTTKVYPDQLNYDTLVTAGLLTVDRGVFETRGPAAMFTVTDPTYNSKDVSDAAHADFTLVYGEYLAARYTPKNDQTRADALITRRPLTVTANRAEVRYGDPAPAYTVTYETASAGSGTGLVSGETADETHVTLSCGYAPGRDVALYPDDIIVSGFTGSATALLSNYDPTYEPGDLEVLQKRLASPAPAWKSGAPGVITWSEVPGVCNVSVAGYTLRLLKDGAPLSDPDATRHVAAGSTLESDFLSLMRQSGAGTYTVEITAVASEVNNTNKENIEDSLPGKSGKRCAAKVTFAFASDAVSQRGKTESLTVQGQSDYVVIAGESGIALAATLANETGYTVRTVNAPATVTVSDPTDTARTGAAFATTFSLSEAHASSADIVLTLALSARPATLTAVVLPAANGEGTVTNETTYGYSAATAPVFKVTCDHNDPVAPTDGYTYSYAWELRTSRTAAPVGTDADTLTLPLGKKANANASYYLVRCVVTATRTDNGQSVSLDQSFNDYATRYAEANTLYNVIIHKATFRADVTMEGWTYGDAPKSPVLLYDDAVSDNTALANTKYYYAPADGSAVPTRTRPSDAGSYKVYAHIPAGDNYNEFTTGSVAFTVAKAKLPAPQNLTMSPGPSADYGLIAWDAVTAPKRDGIGTAVGVRYLVRLFKNGEATPIKTYDPIDGCSMDITADLQLGADYTFEVTAVSLDPANCLDSDPVTSDKLPIGATISASGTGTLNEAGDTFTQKYDGTPVTLTAVASGTADGWQWYKNGSPISGATGRTHTPRHVADSGSYTCAVTIGGETVHTPVLRVVITKRSLTLTSLSDSKTFDGTPLTRHEAEVTGDGFAPDEGVTYAFTGSALHVADTADHNNTFTYSFSAGTLSGDYETPTVTYGTLTIAPKSIRQDTGYTFAAIPDYRYDGTAHKPEPAVTDTARNAALVKGTDFDFSYADNIPAGENTAGVTVTGKNDYKDSVTLYFTIGKRPVTFSAVSEEKTYTGSPITVTGLTVSSGTGIGLLAGHRHNVTFSATGTEASATPYPGTITAKEDVRITLADGTDMTANYDITVTGGSLTVKKTDDLFTVSLDSDSHPYDGTAHYNTKTPTDTAKTGVTVYEYSFTGEGGYTSSLSELTQTDAGTRTIYIRATNPNYSKAATATSALTVGKKPVKITVDGKQVAGSYNGTTHEALGYDLSADSPLYDTASVQFTGVAKAGRTNVGTTEMDLAESMFQNADPNFTASFEVHDGFVHVDPLAGVVITVKGHTEERTYDGSTHTVEGFDWSASTPLYPDSAFTFTGTDTASRMNAGTAFMGLAPEQFVNIDPNFTNVTFSVTDGYERILPVDGVTVTVTGHTESGTYNGSLYTASGYDWSASDPLYKENAFNFSGSPSVSRADAGTSDMGLAPGLFTNTDSNFTNVTFSVTDGYVTVGKKAATITVNGASKTFGEADPAFTGTVTDLVPGESLTGVTYGRANTAEDVAVYEKVLTATYGNNPNYDITVIPADFEITKAATMTVSGTDYKAAYDGNSHGAPATANVSGATLWYSVDNGAWTTEVPTVRNVGKSVIDVKAVHPNYETAYAGYTLEVTPREVRVKADNRSKVYGYGDPSLTVTKTGLLGRDDVSVTLRRASGEKVGTYDIIPAGAEYQGNYRLVFEKGTFTVTRRPAELLWTGDEFIYCGEEAVIFAEITNAVYHSASRGAASGSGPDDVYVTGYKNHNGVAAGTYLAEATDLGGADADNYILVNATHPWTILKSDPGLSAQSATFTYDGAPHSLTATQIGGTGTVTADGNGQTDVGTYTVTFRVSETDNFISGEVKATLTILPKSAASADIEVSDPTDKTYNGKAHTPGLTITDKAIGGGKLLTPDVDYTLSYRNNKNAGTAEITVTFTGNYSGTVKKTFKIRQAPLTLKVKDVSSKVGEALAAPDFEIVSGKLYGNDKPGELTYNRGSMNAPGKYTVTAELVKGTANKNYKITLQPGTYTLKAAAPTNTPKPTKTPSPTKTPAPSKTPAATKTPAPSKSPAVTKTPVPSKSPVPTKTPVPAKTQSVTNTPAPAVSGAPAVTAAENAVATTPPPSAGPVSATETSSPAATVTATSEAGPEETSTRILVSAGITTSSVEEIDDHLLPLAGGPSKICYWHFIMVIIDLLWLVAMVLLAKSPKTGDRKKSGRKYAVSEILVSCVLLLLCVPGFCSLDLLIALLSVAFTAAAAAMSFRRRFRPGTGKI